MRKRTGNVVGLLALACLTVGCIGRPRVLQVVDLSQGRVPAIGEVVVDGRADEEAWRNAAAMPFEKTKTGNASFVWNDTELYGFVGKYELYKFGFDLDEQICVAVRAGNRVARLFFELRYPGDDGRGLMALREAWSCDWPPDATERIPLPGGSVHVASEAGTAKRGCSWLVEFSIRWDSFVDPSSADRRVLVRGYRLVPQRPFTHVLKMELPGRNEGG